MLLTANALIQSTNKAGDVFADLKEIQAVFARTAESQSWNLGSVLTAAQKEFLATSATTAVLQGLCYGSAGIAASKGTTAIIVPNVEIAKSPRYGIAAFVLPKETTEFFALDAENLGKILKLGIVRAVKLETKESFVPPAALKKWRI